LLFYTICTKRRDVKGPTLDMGLLELFAFGVLGVFSAFGAVFVEF